MIVCLLTGLYITGLKIIFGQLPVMLTGQTNFSLVMSRF